MKKIVPIVPLNITDEAAILPQRPLENDPEETTSVNVEYTLVLTLQVDLKPGGQKLAGVSEWSPLCPGSSSAISRPFLLCAAQGIHVNHWADFSGSRHRDRAEIGCSFPDLHSLQDAPSLSIPPSQQFTNLHQLMAGAKTRQGTWPLYQGALPRPTDPILSSQQGDT